MKRIAMTDENWATAIKIAAVLVAVPRWIGALLEADGAALLLTDQTRYWWGLFSAAASAGMALVEGVAFWYTLRAWRQHGGKLLGALIALSMAAFAVVLTPYIMANVTNSKLSQVLDSGWLIAWSSCVSLSTILIVASVGYAQPRKQEQADSVTLDEDCHCPICYSVIGLPVWLSEQHGDKYVAYCDKCERAYIESEVVWLPVGAQVGASVPKVEQQVDKPAQSVSKLWWRKYEKPSQPDSNMSTSSASVPQALKPANLTKSDGQKIDGQPADAIAPQKTPANSSVDEKSDESTTPENTTPKNADSAVVATWDADGLSDAARVRLYSAANPHASKSQVADLLGVNLSTVSRNWRGNGTHKAQVESQ